MYVQSLRAVGKYAIHMRWRQTTNKRHKKQTDIGIGLRFKPCGDDIAVIAPGGREYPATWLKTAGPPGLLQSSNTTIGGHQ